MWSGTNVSADILNTFCWKIFCVQNFTNMLYVTFCYNINIALYLGKDFKPCHKETVKVPPENLDHTWWSCTTPERRTRWTGKRGCPAMPELFRWLCYGYVQLLLVQLSRCSRVTRWSRWKMGVGRLHAYQDLLRTRRGRPVDNRPSTN